MFPKNNAIGMQSIDGTMHLSLNQTMSTAIQMPHQLRLNCTSTPPIHPPNACIQFWLLAFNTVELFQPPHAFTLAHYTFYMHEQAYCFIAASPRSDCLPPPLPPLFHAPQQHIHWR